MATYHQMLVRLQMIEKKLRVRDERSRTNRFEFSPFENSEQHQFLQPDFSTLNKFWNECQISMKNRANFFQLQDDFDRFEAKIRLPLPLDSLGELKNELVQLTHSCQHVSLSDSQLRFFAERIERITGTLTEEMLRSPSVEQVRKDSLALERYQVLNVAKDANALSALCCFFLIDSGKPSFLAR